jgi:hypothetical protein
MIGPDAGANIAVVAHKQPFRDRPVGQHPREAMGQLDPWDRLLRNLAVPATVDPSRPEPAAVWGLVHPRPESVIEGPTENSHPMTRKKATRLALNPTLTDGCLHGNLGLLAASAHAEATGVWRRIHSIPVVGATHTVAGPKATGLSGDVAGMRVVDQRNLGPFATPALAQSDGYFHASNIHLSRCGVKHL